MTRLALILALVCCGCGAAEQPKWAVTVAAYEVPLPTTADKARFLNLVRVKSEAQGFHVDAATPHELDVLSEVSPMTFSASVWRGENDEETIASAMDFEDRIGRVRLSFPLGQDPARSARFRTAVVPEIKKIWPSTRSLPIMPNGAIPLTEDLVRTPLGYTVNPSAAAKYNDESRKHIVR